MSMQAELAAVGENKRSKECNEWKQQPELWSQQMHWAGVWLLAKWGQFSLVPFLITIPQSLSHRMDTFIQGITRTFWHFSNEATAEEQYLKPFFKLYEIISHHIVSMCVFNVLKYPGKPHRLGCFLTFFVRRKKKKKVNNADSLYLEEIKTKTIRLQEKLKASSKWIRLWVNIFHL